MPKYFQRAVFLSWYCAKGDCTFCYMSTQKNRISDPKKAVRSRASILAEIIIIKACDWKIEFLSGGYESFTQKQLVALLKDITAIYGEKIWLNIGALNKDDIDAFLPFTEGVCGALETINPILHKKVCPSKPIEDIVTTFEICKEKGLKKGITFIVGLGETYDDIDMLSDFINKYDVDRITFYALNPHEGTEFSIGPKPDYYIGWIEKVRHRFPDLEIIAGSWVNRLDEISGLIEAGADHITKFPSIRLFGTDYAHNLQRRSDIDGDFMSNMVGLDEKLIYRLAKEHGADERIMKKLEQYIKKMRKNIINYQDSKKI